MTCYRAVVAVVALMALAAPTRATDRWFLDSSAVSANGRFRIDAKSPENAGPSPMAFASRFVYTLTDTITGKTIWQRKQPMTRGKGSPTAEPDEPSPVQVFVHDTGLVVARTAWDSVIILDAANGRKRAEVDVLGKFPADEYGKFVTDSSVGPIWSHESDWFFVTIPASGQQPSRIYFVVRPYWNHRLVIDASSGEQVELGDYCDARRPSDLAGATEMVRTVLKATIEEETRRTLATLATAPVRVKDVSDYHAYWEVFTALHTVGFLGLTHAEPEVRKLDQTPAFHDDLLEGLQRRAREALRALGKTPSTVYAAGLTVETRTANARSISVGMPVGRVIELIGPPDAKLYDGMPCFDYDIDAPEPYTLRVYVDERGQTVQKTRTLTPFAFLNDPARMKGD